MNCFYISFLSPFLDKEWNNNPSAISEGFGLSTGACLAHVKACGGEVKTALNCPRCPDGEPFTDQEALRKHIKWDHELQHLLYGADLVGIDNLKKKLDHEVKHVPNGEDGVASQKDELDVSMPTESSWEEMTSRQEKNSRDATGGSCGSGSSNSSYHTVNEGE